MKKILILITISLLFFSVKVNAENYYTNKNGLEFSKQQYENFIKAGFTEDYIENMETKTYEAYSNMEFVKEDKRLKNTIEKQ